ncbi:MAG: transposase [Candidatus Thiodiazotropha sp.]
MKTSHDVIHGYTGVIAVDSLHQVVVHAEAIGQGQKHGLLKPVVEGIKATFKDKSLKQALKQTKLTADSGYQNREILEYLEAQQLDSYIADTGFRARDPRFNDHKEVRERNKQQDKVHFSQSEIIIDRKLETSRCPAGKAMWLKARHARIDHHLSMQFKGYEEDCNSCGMRKHCLRNEAKHTPRQINVALDITQEQKAGIIERMKCKLDSPRAGISIVNA